MSKKIREDVYVIKMTKPYVFHGALHPRGFEGESSLL